MSRPSAPSLSLPRPTLTASRPLPKTSDMPSIPRVPSSLNKSWVSTSPRSSNESVKWAEDNSDHETLSTPPSELEDLAIEPADSNSEHPLIVDPKTKRRRASTNLIASSAEDIQRLLGDGAGGTKFLQKFCCGGGCCQVQKVVANPKDAGFRPIQLPDNEAFRALKINTDTLALDTALTDIVDVPTSNLSFESNGQEKDIKHAPTTQSHPPEFVQPHPPYNVFAAPLFSARQLTKPGAEKRTYHFDVDITDYPEEGGVEFKVGGAVGICPPNDPEAVEEVFDLLGVPRFLRDKPVRLHTKGGRWPTIWGDEMARDLVTSRRELLTWCSDIESTPPTKPLLRLMAEHASAENEKKVLLYLVSAQGQASFCDLRTGPFVTLSHLLHAFPSSKPPLEGLFTILPQLMPRFYSLSNDPFESSAREGIAGRKLIEVAVTVHENASWRDGKRTGVGSGFLERIAKQYISANENAHDHEACLRKEALDIRLPMFRGLMANPLSREFASDGPMMLIGAGVGMAPFRGFILNRLRNANCANKIWLVQGVRDSSLDEIYAGELGTHEHQIKKVVQSRVSTPAATLREEPQLVPGASFTSSVGGGGGNDSDIDDNASEASFNSALATPTAKRDDGTGNGTSTLKTAKYVQDEVRLQADIVWFVVNAVDGRIFVCGSTKGMGEGVEDALVDVAMEKGNLNRDEAKRFWEGKKEAGQYIAETW